MHVSIEILRRYSFFSKLQESDLKLVFEKIKNIELQKGEYLFHEGEPGEALFILISGKLLVTTLSKGIAEAVGFIRPGEVVGELALFSNEPRSASIQSVQTSVLLRYDKADFQELCYKHPQILWKITASIANRAQQNLHHSHQGNQYPVIAFLSVASRISSEFFLDELEKYNSENYKINFIKKSELTNSLELESVFRKAQEHQSVVFFPLCLEDLNEGGHLLCFADKVVIVIQDPVENLIEVSGVLHEQIAKQVPHIEKELVLLHQEISAVYPNTKSYLNLAQFSTHYHLCFQNPVTCRRLLRRLSGHAVGMVVSGGGAKGWGAVGAVQAIYEHNIELDYVGGTSAGAGIASCYAMSKNDKEFVSIFSPFGKNPMTWKRLTLPIISIFRGQKETDLAKKIYGQIMVEDLTLPFFCVSTNLSLYNEHIWDTGYLWQAVRASTAIPSLVPPMILDGELHVDGSVINNFPLDIMANKLNNQGFILGIEILENSVDLKKYNSPPALSILEAIWMKMTPRKSKIRYVGIAEILQRVIAVGSVLKSKQNAKRADLIIKPDLKEFTCVDFSKKDEMYDIGYKEATKQLKHHKIPQ